MTPHCGPSRKSYDRLLENIVFNIRVISLKKFKQFKRINMNVAINGFGRIIKAVLLNLLNEKYINISLVNDLNPNIDNVCYLINYDSPMAS